MRSTASRASSTVRALARDRHDLVDREAPAVEDDGRQPQTSAAVSAIVASFARSSSSVSALPTTEVAKPHWGERASRSSGTTPAASRIRRGELGDRLAPRRLRRHEPEHADRVVGDVRQRLEAA